MEDVSRRRRANALISGIMSVKNFFLRSFRASSSDAPDQGTSPSLPVLTYSDLPLKSSAFQTLDGYQKFFYSALLLLLGFALWVDLHATAYVLIALVTVFYLCHFLFMLFLVVKSFLKDHEIVVAAQEVVDLSDADLPIYTIFCPLYKEWQVLPQFLAAIDRLDWPKDKLDVLLLLEEDDEESIREIGKLDLPTSFRVMIVPESKPKTKPKACNYGLRHALGEYAVIYDAEDVPEPDQLKKAYLVFQKTADSKVICAQAKLDFYNVHQNLLTRLFALEYALWFDLVLTGLQSAGCPIPLGGTSNHFRTADLHRLNGWDVFNVTEDCDLGMRIAKAGHETVIFNSTTYEEANSQWGNWIRQRSRWIKGYIQTYCVHMRRPGDFFFGANLRSFFAFQLIVGGKIFALFANPFFWCMTATYVFFRSLIGPAIESFYPLPLLYVGVFALAFGNFLYLYYYVLGCLKRHKFDLVKYALFVPFYWLMMSVAAWKALYQLIVKPHYWEKTLHGLHLGSRQSSHVHVQAPVYESTAE